MKFFTLGGYDLVLPGTHEIFRNWHLNVLLRGYLVFLVVWPSTKAVRNRKKRCSCTQFFQKSPRALHVSNNWFLALHVFTHGFPTVQP